MLMQTMISYRRWVPSGAGAALVLMFTLPVMAAPSAPRKIEESYAQHTRAVELARNGDYDAGLVILRRLLHDFADDYPLNRDFILISTWKGDCNGAVARFAQVRQQPRFEPYFVQAIAGCAVQRAQAGHYDEALDILEPLAAREPDNYPLQRDIIVITTWKGDCPAALRRFDALTDRPTAEAYVAIAITDCLLDAERPREAATLVREALTVAADDQALQHALIKARLALNDLDDPYRELVVELATDNSDQGLREWRSRVEFSAPLMTDTRLYVRYLHTHSEDGQYRDGDLNRIGLGLRRRFAERWQAEIELANDTQRSNQRGAAARLVFAPRDTWQLQLAANNFAEDLPLRARAIGVEAAAWESGAEYNSLDHVWHWRATANSWDYSDTNRRNSFFTTLGYAYDLRPYREQRVYAEWYQSRNSLTAAPYFNPRQDHSLGIVQRSDFIFASRFKRHVDSLSLTLAVYEQEGYATATIGGVKYEQEYDLDDFNEFVWALSYGRSVYDGAAEYMTSAQLRYRWRF